jgi:hypothetical protein
VWVWITFKEVVVSKAAQHFADMKRFYENGGYSQAKECYFLLMEEYRKSRKNKNDASAIYEFVKDADIMDDKMNKILAEESND